jgi:16S rRNA (cytosine1402-N4)-methyltransferase
LGYSLNQIKDNEKGLSFSSQGQLNMKLGLNDFSAKEVINKLESNDLQKIFKYFGEEKDAKKIANRIVNERVKQEIDTQNLVNIIESVKRRNNAKIHSSTKVFQAIRIFVNKEISELIHGLINATKILKKNGILAVVSFHSLEDKIVKYFFRSLSENKSISRYQPKIIESEPLFFTKQRKPIVPGKKELSENISSRSAKLRFIIKKKNFYNFDTDVFKKFKSLIEVENISNKL